MTILDKTIETLCNWAGIVPEQITSIQTEICVVLATGRPGIPCDTDTLSPLVIDIREAFPNKKLGGLRASDLKSPGKITTINALADFIAKSGNKAKPAAAKKKPKKEN